MEADPVVLPSAGKHGVDSDDLLHAYRNPVRIYEQDDEMIVVIGAARDGTMLEVGVVAGDLAGFVIVHGMRARRKYLR